MLIALLLAVALPAAPERGRFILDAANVLPPADVQRLERLSEEVDGAGVGQLAIVTVTDLYGRADRKELAVDLFKAWGVGHKRSRGRDDGVLVLLKVSQPDRGIKIEVGYDMEGRINDGKAGALARSAIPLFQAQRWGDGLFQIAGGLAAEMRAEGAMPRKEEDGISTGTLVAIVMGVVLLFLFAAWLLFRKRKQDDEAADQPRREVPPAFVPTPVVFYEQPPSTYYRPPDPTPTSTRSDPSLSYDSSSSWGSGSSSSDSGFSGGGSDGGGGFDGGSSGGGGSDSSF